jgi:hypothetical protein
MMAIRHSKKARRPKRKRITYFAYEPSAEKTNWSIEEIVIMEEIANRQRDPPVRSLFVYMHAI